MFRAESFEKIEGKTSRWRHKADTTQEPTSGADTDTPRDSTELQGRPGQSLDELIAELNATETPDKPQRESLTPLEARRGIRRMGWMKPLSALLRSDTDLNEEWEYGLEFRRDSPLIRALARSTRATEADLDRLFSGAA
jgi:hypothetical protein